MKSLKSFATFWTLMWGISYIIVAIIAPTIVDFQYATGLYIALGLSILVGLFNLFLLDNPINHAIARIMFILLGILMVFGGICSWAGLTTWNIPFDNKGLFQVSMAFADLLSAVFMFIVALD